MQMNFIMAIPVLFIWILVMMLPIFIGVYVYRDAKTRGMNAVLWALVAALAPSLIGLIIYLLVRGSYSNLRCPQCGTSVQEQYVICPQCGAKIRPSCPNCAMPVEPDWKVCPRCTQPLPEVQEDIVVPVRPKDKGLWKVLAIILVIPVVLILVLGLSFSAVSGGGSSSMREITTDEYFADEEVPESTKAYVREWLDTIPKETNHAYALRYTHRFDPESDSKDYYYLIYIPGGGEASQRGFGVSAGLFGSTLKLKLTDPSGQDGLYCMMTTSKKNAPQLRVTIDDKRLEDEVTVVEFNPTLYTIATEQEREILKEAAGDLYVTEIVP